MEGISWRRKMETFNLSGKAIIAGVGETAMGKLPGKSSLALHALASKLALEDTGLTKSDIDGVLTCGSLVDNWPHHSGAFCEYFDIQPKYTDTVTQGGAGSCTMVQYAAMLIATGVCQTVLTVGADNQLSAMTRNKAIQSFAKNRHPQYEYPFGLSTPAGYALIAQRHFHEFGTTRKHLANIAVVCRKHASLNPNAQARNPLSLEEALNSKPIASPLHLNDCCISSDGGGAVIVTSADRSRDLKNHPIVILGTGQGFSYEHICQAHNITDTGVRRAGKVAFEMARIEPKDIDVVELYDCFTITVLVQLEDYGFCPKGGGGSFVGEGHIQLGSKLPVNTNGGMLSFGNPGIAGGIFHIIEAVRQLRGDCGPRQVVGAQLALVGGVGGIFSHTSTLILGR
jgi:acetyl-CoA acetyltransferase